MKYQKISVEKYSFIRKASFWQLEKLYYKSSRSSKYGQSILTEMLRRAVTFEQCCIVYKEAVVESWLKRAAFRKMSKYAVTPYQLLYVYNQSVAGSQKQQAILRKILKFNLPFDQLEQMYNRPDSGVLFKSALLRKMSKCATTVEEHESVYFKASSSSPLKRSIGRKMLEIDATYDQWDRINRRACNNFDSWLEKATLQKMLEKSTIPDHYEVVYSRSIPGSDFRGRILLEVPKIAATFNQWDRVYLSAKDTCDHAFLKVVNNKSFESATTFRQYKSVYERAGSDRKLKKATISKMKIQRRKCGENS